MSGNGSWELEEHFPLIFDENLIRQPVVLACIKCKVMGSGSPRAFPMVFNEDLIRKQKELAYGAPGEFRIDS